MLGFHLDSCALLVCKMWQTTCMQAFTRALVQACAHAFTQACGLPHAHALTISHAPRGQRGHMHMSMCACAHRQAHAPFLLDRSHACATSHVSGVHARLHIDRYVHACWLAGAR